MVAAGRPPALPAGQAAADRSGRGWGHDARKWQWKVALQGLADEFDLVITVTHYPPGASWNPIDHRRFSLISGSWAGEPLTSYEGMLKDIRTTRSSEGFHGRACLDYGTSRRGGR